jgi:hypothetical protein
MEHVHERGLAVSKQLRHAVRQLCSDRSTNIPISQQGLGDRLLYVNYCFGVPLHQRAARAAHKTPIEVFYYAISRIVF